ncbi:type IX secretion system protein PorD [Taibaiella soli]|uniref:DUF4835 domain-containing protein n=1 Tax=Taibaiella soli TaxID=1649169 RepID=A0A2W2BUE4_9BACT|nr:DUF4835 family protein [Taibaiella soli]PZF71443.1 DUF4835 domain-containing protein [Taibaiella soli]
MYRKIISVFCLLACSLFAQAQELNCKVKVMHEKIQNTDPQVFTAMERAITEFLNTRKWTTDEYQVTERIDVNVLINLTDKTSDDIYSATINIQSTRPVYNTNYNTSMVNYMDRDLVFHYAQYSNLTFDDNRVSGTDPMESNLTAVLAYYAYVVLGLDYDSFSPNGGNAYFKKAQNVVNNAPESKAISGWKAFEDKKNRYWLVDQLLSPRFSTFRTYWYSMHREGLDNMFSKPADARKKILAGIPILSQLNKDNPSAMLIQFFFTAKSTELASAVAQLPREERGTYVTMLAAMDVPNTTKYNSLK